MTNSKGREIQDTRIEEQKKNQDIQETRVGYGQEKYRKHEQEMNKRNVGYMTRIDYKVKRKYRIYEQDKDKRKYGKQK